MNEFEHTKACKGIDEISFDDHDEIIQPKPAENDFDAGRSGARYI